MFVHTLEDQLLRHQAEVQFQVYWQRDAEAKKVRAAWQEMDGLPRCVSVKTFTPDTALEVLAQTFDSRVDLQKFSIKNPLPATALVTFKLPRENQIGWVKEVLARLQAFPLVEKVHYNPLRIDVAHSWMQLSKKGFWPVICFLILVVGLVVGNTIKLALFQRRDEIEILRLVGASRMYIRLPLVIGGAVQGLLGGVFALGLLKLVHLGLQDTLNFPPLWIQIPFLSLHEILGMFTVLILVGVVSSFVALKEG